ncbi:MAG TPA: hypothetical protein VGN65_05775, partial [Casimicrobiaceae bacterium]
MQHSSRALICRILSGIISCIAGCITLAAPASAAAQLATQSATQNHPPAVVASAEQLVVVTTAGWDSLSGTLRRFQRANTKARWRAVGGTTPIVVGRTGLAWGVGFDDVGRALDPNAPHKYE